MEERAEMNQVNNNLSMHPGKFALWLFIVTVVMIFAALTSAYIVKQSEGNWLEFSLPSAFVLNTVIILLSSVSMQWAYLNAKKDQLDGLKIMLGITLVLGVFFLVGQFTSWNQLVDSNVYFVGNPAGSFVYVLTGLHGLHLVSAIIFLLVVFVNALNLKIHSKALVSIEMCATYWHFLGGLWIYLYVFLLFNQ
ncbi:MAG: heme-copper oxidase subunit III [Cyclobacteriaceae bacterium]